MQQNDITKKQLRQFGLIVGISFILFIGYVIASIKGYPFRFWTLWVSIPLILLGFFKPFLLLNPYKFWIKLGYFLGWVNSKIILSIIYIFVLLPIAGALKLFNYDPLNKKQIFKNSYKENKKDYKSDLKRIF